MFLNSKDPKMQDHIQSARAKARELCQSHQVDEHGAKLMQVIRDNFAELTTLVIMSTRPSREQSLALTNLEQAQMWTNKGISSAYPVVGSAPEPDSPAPPPPDSL